MQMHGGANDLYTKNLKQTTVMHECFPCFTLHIVCCFGLAVTEVLDFSILV